MALTNQQLWIATKIDTRMQKLIRAGKDNMAIMAAMADHMPAFHELLTAAQPAEMDQLTRKFPGFYRYAKILELLATGIQSGAIPVPGRKEAPRQTDPMTDYRQRAAAMDLRMRQLAEEGVPRSAIIARMTGYVVDLGTIWNTTTDEQLAALCRDYPGFHTYAKLMEEAAEAERQKPARPYDGLPALPDALKEQLSSLLQHRRQTGTRLPVRARCRRHGGASGVASAARQASCPMAGRSDTLQGGTPGRRRATDVARHGPASPRPHGAADRQTRSPRPGRVTIAAIMRSGQPVFVHPFTTQAATH